MYFIIPRCDECQADKTRASTNKDSAGVGSLSLISRVVAQAPIPQTPAALLIPKQRN